MDNGRWKKPLYINILKTNWGVVGEYLSEEVKVRYSKDLNTCFCVRLRVNLQGVILKRRIYLGKKIT